MRATRADAAKKAGVSTATVSYVLNGSRNMSEKTKKLVMDAVRASPEIQGTFMKMMDRPPLTSWASSVPADMPLSP